MVARAHDAEIALAPPFKLAAASDCAALESVVRRVSVFAGLLILVLGALAAIGAIPRLLLAMPLAWAAALALAWSAVARARSRHGRIVIDLLEGRFRGRTRAGRSVEGPVEALIIRQEASSDEALPFWLVATFPGGSLRLGRVNEASRAVVLHALRSHHVRIDVALQPKVDDSEF